MNLDEMLEHAIKLHAEFHMGRAGLSDEDFKNEIKQIIKDEADKEAIKILKTIRELNK